jgi:hypothetical protein
MNIRDLLNRMSDLSTFLVHLTRDYDDIKARDNLKQILESRKLEARNVYGHLKGRIRGRNASMRDQKVVCFTETPLEYTSVMIEDIEEREFRFKPYGIAIPKRLARRKGVNPVWYVDMTPGHDWLTVDLDKLAEAYLNAPERLEALGKIFPFVEHMGSGERAMGSGSYRKEFWWEREWRHIGDFPLPSTFILLCPEHESDLSGELWIAIYCSVSA